MSELYNIGIEQLIISSILSKESLYDDIASIMDYKYFYEPIHQEIFKLIQKKLNQGEIVNALTVMNLLADKGINSSYIIEIVEMIAPSSNLLPYVNLLRKLYVSRELKALGQEIQQINNPEDIDKYLDKIENKCYSLSYQEKTHDPIDFYIEAQKSLVNILNNRKISGIPTLFSVLDSCIGGLRKGELIILAARPSMGKTALALNIATNIAKNNNSVLFFSLEMPASQLCLRVISSLSKVALSSLIHGNIPDHIIKDCMATMNQYANLPLYIIDTSSINVSTIKSVARRWKRNKQYQDGCIIIDYLQLIESLRYSNDTHEQEISRISRALKVLARELDIPVIALSQMSRNIENRKDAPKLSDLRGSGSIEQDADIVMFLHKEENNNIVLSVAKNRNGPLLSMNLNYFSEITTFA